MDRQTERGSERWRDTQALRNRDRETDGKGNQDEVCNKILIDALMSVHNSKVLLQNDMYSSYEWKTFFQTELADFTV